MIIQTDRFGELEILEENIFHLPKGMPGFPEEKGFILLPHEDNSPFFFWQSTTNQSLTFVLVDPFAFFSDYQFEINDDIQEELRINETNLPQIFCVVTIPKEIKDMTANLLAPLVLSQHHKIAMQVVLEKTSYQTKHRLFQSHSSGQAQQGGK